MSKELENIKKAIQKYCKKYNNNVQFIGAFCAFEGKNCDVVDDLILAYGYKDTLKIDLTEISKMLKKEKGEFINW